MSPLKLIFTILALSSGLLLAQNTPGKVWYWQGNSSFWQDESNWVSVPDGFSGLPGINDHVVFSHSAATKQIVHAGHLHVASITVANPEGLSLLLDSKSYSIPAGLLSSDEGVRGNNLAQLIADWSQQHHVHNHSITDGIKHKAKAGARGSCPFFTIVPNPTNPTCNGFNNGIASIIPPTDGVGPYAYQWVGGPGAPQWNNLGAGTYTIIVFDMGQAGAPCNTDVFVNEPGPLTVFSMNSIPPSCFGDCDGSAAPVVIGGNGGYTFTWPDGGTGPTNNALCSTFTLNITDQLGCTIDTTYISLNAPEQIVLTPTITDVVCFGDNNGQIDVSISGGVGTVNISWSGPGGFVGSGTSIGPLQPGLYTANAIDDNGCTSQQNFNVNEFPPLDALATPINNICGGASDGAISLSISGGTSPYDIAWTGPGGYTGSGAFISDLLSGNYQATITDDNGCVLVVNSTVSEPTPISVSISSTDVPCSGNPTGSIQATASGGTGTLSYAWTGPSGFTSSQPNISNLVAGVYELTIQDQLNCTLIETVTLNEPSLLEATLTSTPITCSVGNDGTIDLTITGGTSPYTILWTGPGGFTSSNQNLNGLAAGNYSVLITDFNGCSLTDAINLPNPSPLNISGTVTNTTCASNNNGAIAIAVAGGLEPYAFLWSGPMGFSSTSQNISNLVAGSYTVTVTDAEGCSSAQVFNVSSPAAITANFSITHALCFGVPTGAINTTPSGGTAPYSFLWIGPSGFIATTQNISNAPGGDYTVMITDANGCMVFIETIINQPPQININRVITNVTCFGGSNGAISISVSGGTPGYTYLWSGPNGFSSTSQNISGRPAGTYIITVTDSNGCEATRTYNITQPTQITVSGTSTNVVCAGDNNGTISVAASGGVGPYSYAWNGPGGYTSNQQNITGLAPGNYTVIASNSQGCNGTASFQIIQTTVIEVVAATQNITCFGNANGSIDLTITGGQAPYNITWSGPGGFTDSGSSIAVLGPGNYIYMLTDANGCVEMSSIAISEPNALTASVNTTDIICNGDDNGTAEALVSGGTLPYSLQWSGPAGFVSTDVLIDNLEAGTYDLLVTDAQGCTTTASGDVNEPSELVLNVLIIQPDCLVDDGELTANVSGGIAVSGYTYFWTNQAGNPVGNTMTISNLGPGSFTVLVTDDNGCSETETVALIRDVFDVSESVQNTSCIGSSDGSININLTGGTPPVVFSWTGPGGFSSNQENIAGLAIGSYTLTITDGAGCASDLFYEITEPNPLIINALVVYESCSGFDNGSISSSVTGGTPGYLYQWSGPSGFMASQPSIVSLVPGIYQLTIIDGNGCTTDTTIGISAASPLSVSLSANDVLCNGAADGSAEVTAIGGTGTYTFAWTGPSGFVSGDQSIGPIGVGAYEVVVTDANGCQLTDVAIISEPDPLDASVLTTGSTCGVADGTAEAMASGGMAPIVYNWLDQSMNLISTSPTISSLSAGMYTLQVIDANGCTDSQPFVIFDADGGIDSTVDHVSCPGLSDGAISAQAFGGTEPYSYEWVGPAGFTSNLAQITDLTAGTYSLLATDANGCIFGEVIEVSEPLGVSQTATIVQADCNGTNGSIDLTLTGGLPPYDIQWAGPDGYTSTGLTISGLMAGTYTNIITDGAGCVSGGSVEVTAVDQISVSETITNALCGELSDGIIDIQISGGTAPYNVLWTGPDGFVSNQLSISGLQGGTYELLVTDAASCGEQYTFNVLQPDSISMDFIVTEPSCQQDDGAIEAIVTGGTATMDYFYSWFDGAGQPAGFGSILSNLGPGLYSLSVSDDNGCGATTDLVLSNPGIAATGTTEPALCFGDSDGAIEIEVTGAAEPFTVDWAGPDGYTSTGTSISGLEAGVYTYTITDDDGCQLVGTLEVQQPGLIQVSALASLSCFGESNGTINAAITGGTAPYIAAWQGPDGFTASGTSLSDLAPGLYELTVTDSNGCEWIYDTEIDENPEITVDADATHLTCFGEDDGILNASANGGVGPYEFTWSGPDGFSATGSNVINVAAGVYSISVTDQNGCTVVTNLEVESPDEITFDLTVTPTGCTGFADDGAIALVASGGIPGYNVEWTGPNGFTSADFSLESLVPGTYQFEITDATGCALSGTAEVEASTPLEVETSQTAVDCNGLSNGSASVSILSGNAPFDFVWSGPNGFTATTEEITELPAGTYEVTVTDQLGCTVQEVVSIQEPTPLLIELIGTSDPTCNTSPDGSIAVQGSGGTAPYSYAWTGPAGFTSSEAQLDGLLFGIYTLTLTDANGCIETLAISLDFSIEIQAYAGDDAAYCINNQPVVLTGSSLNADSYIWTTLDGDTLSENETYSSGILPEGSYAFVLHVSNGFCSNTDTLDIVVHPLPDASAGPDREVFTEEAFTLGGNPTSVSGISYLWAPAAEGGFNTTSANPTGFLYESTLFVLFVTDPNGCVGTDTVRITVIPDVIITSGFTPNDDGVNDRWVIDNMHLFPANVVSIYNRWGMPVYRAAPYTNSTAWDGTFEGKALPVGTYYYTIELNDPRYPKPFTGPVTIHR